jgi:hypothetical protein
MGDAVDIFGTNAVNVLVDRAGVGEGRTRSEKFEKIGGK